MSSLQEVKEQAVKLSASDRLTLVNLIVQSLQNEFSQSSQVAQGSQARDSQTLQDAVPAELKTKKADLINQMRGFLKTDTPAPNDAEIQTMLEERLVEKYLQ